MSYRETIEVVLYSVLLVALLGLAVLLGCEPAFAAPRESPYPEPPGYAQPEPNPLEGDAYGDTREEPKDQTATFPRELDADDPILRCSKNIEIVKAEIVYESISPRGELAKGIRAITKEGRAIFIMALHPVLQTLYDRQTGTVNVEAAKYATAYLVDLDGDGQVDSIYTDKGGTGNCEDIKPYTKDYDSKPESETKQEDCDVLEGHSDRRAPDGV